jgi:hypothetical protein
MVKVCCPFECLIYVDLHGLICPIKKDIGLDYQKLVLMTK